MPTNCVKPRVASTFLSVDGGGGGGGGGGYGEETMFFISRLIPNICAPAMETLDRSAKMI